jgi:predicted nucleic acid-binding Zn ribbon protein
VDDDPVRAALARARGLTGTRSGRRRGHRTGRGTPAGSGDARRGGYSGPAQDANDPAPVGEVLAGYVAERGWSPALNAARIFSDWAGMVGTDVAAHCAPGTLRDGVLTVRAESTAWATQLRLLGATLLARVVAEVGPGVVHKVVVTGPSGPNWKHGRFSVRGSRGPRDTYG